MRNALTMIEVIFVIVVLGIVASIGSEIIAQVYQGYITQRAQYRASIKTELALNQIANRFRYAIPGTVMAEDGGTLRPITEIASVTSNRLQWVAYDGDSFESTQKPGWSGFIDLNGTLSASNIETPGSDLGKTDSIIKHLGGSGITGAEIYFPDGSHYAVSGGGGTTLNLSMNSGDRVFERYKLAWSSYAVVYENGDLYLYYNFSPRPGATVNADTNKSLLLKNVTVFRFRGSEGSLRIKLCKNEPLTAESNITACKEKVIF
jgi:prepilin-type N-terminal cleavage/methylation domain-containing protein